VSLTLSRQRWHKYAFPRPCNPQYNTHQSHQIRTTLAIELESAKRSWLDVFSTKAMRKRLLITSMIGLFTQWSGNTLQSYYLSDLLKMVGFTNAITRQKFNVGLSCWGLVNAVALAFVVLKVRRRVMYQTCVLCLLAVYIGWTVSFKIAQERTDRDEPAGAAGAVTVFWIFAYSPA
jgi:hypothetical protein